MRKHFTPEAEHKRVAIGCLWYPTRDQVANHMSAIENSRNIKLTSTHLSLLGNARIYLPSRPLDMKKEGAAIDIDAPLYSRDDAIGS